VVVASEAANTLISCDSAGAIARGNVGIVVNTHEPTDIHVASHTGRAVARGDETEIHVHEATGATK